MKRENSPARLRSQARQVHTKEHKATPDQQLRAMLPVSELAKAACRRQERVNRSIARHMNATTAMHSAAVRSH